MTSKRPIGRSQVVVEPSSRQPSEEDNDQVTGLGMILGLAMGILLLALVAWWTFTQSGWFSTSTPASSTVTVRR